MSNVRLFSDPCLLSYADANHNPNSTEGEFHVDLYTLPDTLVKMLWDFTQEKGGIWRDWEQIYFVKDLFYKPWWMNIFAKMTQMLSRCLFLSAEVLLFPAVLWTWNPQSSHEYLSCKHSAIQNSLSRFMTIRHPWRAAHMKWRLFFLFDLCFCSFLSVIYYIFLLWEVWRGQGGQFISYYHHVFLFFLSSFYRSSYISLKHLYILFFSTLSIWRGNWIGFLVWYSLWLIDISSEIAI